MNRNYVLNLESENENISLTLIFRSHIYQESNLYRDIENKFLSEFDDPNETKMKSINSMHISSSPFNSKITGTDIICINK